MSWSSFHRVIGFVFILISSALHSATAFAFPPNVINLRTEGLSQIEQVDSASPRFSWQLQSSERNESQTAYQLRISEIGPDKASNLLIESDRISSSESQWISFPGFSAKSRAVYEWQVRVWNNRGDLSQWSEPLRFGTGLIGSKWPADWIGSGAQLSLQSTSSAKYFRNVIKLDKKPFRARLFMSAMGLIEPWINGRLVTEDRFLPGWPDYHERLFYTVYDVTDLLQDGDNGLGFILGDGWYSGTMLPHHQFGQEAKLSAFLDITYADGKVATIITDKNWQWSGDGPIRMNSIYHGESYDASRENETWSMAESKDSWSWYPVNSMSSKHISQNYTARIAPPIRRVEELKPVSVRETSPGTYIYDMGQNMVGWVRLKLNAPSGTEVRIRHTEMLDKDGNVYTGNLRSAQATAKYLTKGKGVESWEPRFTYFGFRYVEVTGIARPLEDAVTGVVLHNDLKRIGFFESSDPWLNKLFNNTLWSQKGNFFEVPTDCPQRDERLGWTGDAQVFASTALYNMDAGSFYRQWLFSVRDSLRDGPEGGFPDTAPHTGWGYGSAGWGDAGIIIPWLTWLHTGDRKVLIESLPSIQHALEIMAAQAPDGIRRSKSSWGDWLAPGFDMYKSPPSYEVLATAYLAHSADIAARIADVLGRPELASSNRAIRDKSRAAFQREFIDKEGRISGDVQTSYLIAIAFDLVPQNLKAKVNEHLVKKFTEKDNHLATGFLGTPLITPVLTSIGRADLAYTILQQKTYPGWLFSVKNGATTIWERWDSWTPENGFNKSGMNSFNHYAYGAVVSWFYDTIVGLQPVAWAPGWKHFRIAPSPGGGLTSASGKVETPYGRAESQWKIENDFMFLHVVIPPNTNAEVVLPTTNYKSIFLDEEILRASRLPLKVLRKSQEIKVLLPSGTYNFRFTLAH